MYNDPPVFNDEDVTDIVTVANQLFNANSKNESMGAALSRLMTNIFSVFGSDDNTNAGDDEWKKRCFRTTNRLGMIVTRIKFTGT